MRQESPLFPVAPHFTQRLQWQLASLREAKKNTEAPYPFSCGDYSTDTFPIYGLLRGEVEHEPAFTKLGGVEKYVAQLVEQQLQQKGNTPAIFLDLGGDLGISWGRLALHFQKQIEASQIAFVVHNLNMDPRTRINEFNFPPVYRSIVEKGSKLVHYADGPSSSLAKKAVCLPNGNVLDIAGNVALIHERYSLTHWSQIPEIDLMAIPHLLSQRGIYIVDYYSQFATSGKHRDNKDYPEADQHTDRLKATEIGHRLLTQRYNFTKTTKVSLGRNEKGADLHYTVFSRQPEQPAVVSEEDFSFSLKG